ncbi:DUF5381 family protein [Metabacillus sp. KIGAM252]|uniref:DUF5381 family protein n=1 Tax=Metabacillus flavus TaxID=2823519 RepID=A0ABS5LJF3_9BACI|nr:DUF5381 family protein [Metabacillus flavus]
MVTATDNRIDHTFNTLGLHEFKRHIEKYVLPHMNPRAQEAWNRKFTNGRVQP